MHDRIILASASPRRKQLLSKIGIEFHVRPSSISEEINCSKDFTELVTELAFRKAMAVAKNYSQGLVIGADTIVVLDDNIMGKPKNHQEAEKMLKSLSGRWHQVLTGLSVVDAATGKCVKDFEKSCVKFKNLSISEIQNYVKTGEPMDKAGAYAIQGKGALFIEKIDGDYYNIVGLPLYRLSLMLEQFGIKML